MIAQMSAATKQVLKAPRLKLIIDEADLLTSDRRDAIGEALKRIRDDARPDGGVQVGEFGDLFQGEPCMSKEERVRCAPGAYRLGPRRMLTIEGDHMNEAGRATCFLRQTERFRDSEYRAGIRDIRLGHVSAAAKQLVTTANARELTAEEDLEGMTLFGTSEEVMSR